MSVRSTVVPFFIAHIVKQRLGDGFNLQDEVDDCEDDIKNGHHRLVLPSKAIEIPRLRSGCGRSARLAALCSLGHWRLRPRPLFRSAALAALEAQQSCWCCEPRTLLFRSQLVWAARMGLHHGAPPSVGCSQSCWHALSLLVPCLRALRAAPS